MPYEFPLTVEKDSTTFVVEHVGYWWVAECELCHAEYVGHSQEALDDFRTRHECGVHYTYVLEQVRHPGLPEVSG